MYDSEILTDLLNKTLDCLKKIQTRAESISKEDIPKLAEVIVIILSDLKKTHNS